MNKCNTHYDMLHTGTLIAVVQHVSIIMRIWKELGLVVHVFVNQCQVCFKTQILQRYC
jgi:hypothetical protein